VALGPWPATRTVRRAGLGDRPGANRNPGKSEQPRTTGDRAKPVADQPVGRYGATGIRIDEGGTVPAEPRRPPPRKSRKLFSLRQMLPRRPFGLPPDETQRFGRSLHRSTAAARL